MCGVCSAMSVTVRGFDGSGISTSWSTCCGRAERLSDERPACPARRPGDRRSSSAVRVPAGRPDRRGWRSRQRSSDRHPQPMHSVNPSLRRSSSAIRSSIWALHQLESRAQSRRVGTRWGGRVASSAPICSSVSPTCWANTMKAIRRRTTGRGYRRWPDPARSELISPRCS